MQLEVAQKQAENICIYWRILKNEPFWRIFDFSQCQKIRDALSSVYTAAFLSAKECSIFFSNETGC